MIDGLSFFILIKREFDIRNLDLVGETDVIFLAHDANRGKIIEI